MMRIKRYRVDLDRLYKLFEAKGMTYQAVADEVGFCESVVSRHCRGAAPVGLDALARYAIFFGVSTDYLLGLTDSPNPIYDEMSEDAKLAMVIEYTGLRKETVERRHATVLRGGKPWRP